MGKTLPMVSQVFLQEEQAFARFRRALRRADQLALDDLFIAAGKHTAVFAQAAHALPFESMLLAMLLEEHKIVMQLRGRLNDLLMWAPKEQPRLELPMAKLAEEVMESGLARGEPVTEPGEVEYIPVDE